MNNAGNRAVGDVLCMCYSKDSTFYLGASSGMTQMKLHSGNPAEVRNIAGSTVSRMIWFTVFWKILTAVFG